MADEVIICRCPDKQHHGTASGCGNCQCHWRTPTKPVYRDGKIIRK
jgi:hypothetical protein